LGRELYGERWAEVRGHNVARMTDGQSASSTELTLAQLQKLIEGMQQIKRARKAQAAASEEREA
jgi:hypothetical protein